jgi:hypothetical protein
MEWSFLWFLTELMCPDLQIHSVPKHTLIGRPPPLPLDRGVNKQVVYSQTPITLLHPYTCVYPTAMNTALRCVPAGHRHANNKWLLLVTEVLWC